MAHDEVNTIQIQTEMKGC